MHGAASTYSAPPLASSSIFSIDRGPRVVRMMSDTACKGQQVNASMTRKHTVLQLTSHSLRALAFAAMIFPDWAFFPVSLLVLPARTLIGACIILAAWNISQKRSGFPHAHLLVRLSGPKGKHQQKPGGVSWSGLGRKISNASPTGRCISYIKQQAECAPADSPAQDQCRGKLPVYRA